MAAGPLAALAFVGEFDIVFNSQLRVWGVGAQTTQQGRSQQQLQPDRASRGATQPRRRGAGARAAYLQAGRIPVAVFCLENLNPNVDCGMNMVFS